MWCESRSSGRPRWGPACPAACLLAALLPAAVQCHMSPAALLPASYAACMMGDCGILGHSNRGCVSFPHRMLKRWMRSTPQLPSWWPSTGSCWASQTACQVGAPAGQQGSGSFTCLQLRNLPLACFAAGHPAPQVCRYCPPSLPACLPAAPEELRVRLGHCIRRLKQLWPAGCVVASLLHRCGMHAWLQGGDG